MMMHLAEFAVERWAALCQTCRAWWRDELERPLIAVTVHGCEPGRPLNSNTMVENNCPLDLYKWPLAGLRRNHGHE